MPSDLGKVNVIYSVTSQFSRNALSKKLLMSKTKLISKIFHFDNPTKLTGGLSTWGRRKRQKHSWQDPVCSHWSHSGWLLALSKGRLRGASVCHGRRHPGRKGGHLLPDAESQSGVWAEERVFPARLGLHLCFSLISLQGSFPASEVSLRYAARKWYSEGLPCWQQRWFLLGFRCEQYRTLSKQILKNSECVSPFFFPRLAHYAQLWAYLVNYMKHVLLPLRTSETFWRL